MPKRAATEYGTVKDVVDFTAKKQALDDVMRMVATWFVESPLATHHAPTISALQQRGLVTTVAHRLRHTEVPRYAYTMEGLLYLCGTLSDTEWAWLVRYLSKCAERQPAIRLHYRDLLDCVDVHSVR